MPVAKETRKKLTICYFGIYRPDSARNRIYINGLRQNNVNILECYDHGQGLKKFITLFFKHWQLRNDYDVMIVGYASQITVFFARLITNKPIIFNALSSLYEANIISRNLYPSYSLKGILTWIIDWSSCFFAELVLVESNEQKKFFIKKFKINPNKCLIFYTGADDSIFYPDSKIEKHQKFTVLFRGRFLPEAGVEHILNAAKILENKNVDFLLIGHGMMEAEVKNQIKNLNLHNTTLVTEELEIKDLRKRMSKCHISLGQFEDHERLKRTIPHKAFESLAMRLPYITGNTLPINEILSDKKNCLMIKLSDPDGLARAIITLKNDPNLRHAIANDGYRLYQEKFSPISLGKELKSIINNRILD